MAGRDRSPVGAGGSGSGSPSRLRRREIRPVLRAGWGAFFDGRESRRTPVIQLPGGKAKRMLADLR